MFAELRRVKYEYLEDMVCRMGLIYDEIVDILDVKFIAPSTSRFTIPPRSYQFFD